MAFLPKRVFWPPKIWSCFCLLLIFVTMGKGSGISGATLVANKTLVQYHDSTCIKVVPNKLKVLEKRDLDAQVDRDLKERFSDYTYIDTDVRLIDGLTMRQELRLHKQEALASNRRLSTTFWRNFRTRWARVNSPAALLTVKVKSEPIDPLLISALDRARTSNTRLRSSTPLLSWLTNFKGEPNQKTLIGVYKHSLSSHPSAGKHLIQVLAIMRWSAKFGAKVLFVEEAKAMTSHWDLGLLAHLATMTKAGMTISKFIEVNVEILKLVLDEVDMKKVIAAGAAYRQCPDELRRLVASSQIGSRLFSSLLCMMANDEFLAEVDKIIEETLNDDISMDDVKTCFERCQKAAEKWEVDQRCPQRREISVTYRKLQLSIMIQHSNDIIRRLTNGHPDNCLDL